MDLPVPSYEQTGDTLGQGGAGGISSMKRSVLSVNWMTAVSLEGEGEREKKKKYKINIVKGKLDWSVGHIPNNVPFSICSR